MTQISDEPVRSVAIEPVGLRKPGTVERAAAFAACAGMLVYAGEKVYMSAIGKIGMPGSVAPASVQSAYEHASLAQAGNAAVGVVAALFAVVAVASWGARAPRWFMLAGLALTATVAAAGGALTVTQVFSRSGGPLWTAVGLVWAVVAPLAWFVLAMSYARRTRLVHPPVGAEARVRVAAASVAATLTLLYAGMKLNWALGGEFLMRQAPLAAGARADLLARTPLMVAGHWVSAGLGLVGLVAALYLAGWFTARGRLQRGLLLVGTSVVAVLTVARACAGAYGDLRRLSAAGGDGLGSSLARWDLFVWSPAWLVLGLAFGIAAALWWRGDAVAR